MVPYISSVELNTNILIATETNLYVTAIVADDTGTTAVYAVLFDPLLGEMSNEIMLTLTTGTDLNGTYNGTMTIPLDVINGYYQIVVLAANAATVQDDYGTYGINDDAILYLERSSSEPEEPTGPVEPGETDTNDKSCCKVTININAGPVNIYVCDSEKKTEITG